MTDKPLLEKARSVILVSDKSKIDYILSLFNITHAKYRKLYPDTPITPILAMEVMDAKDLNGWSNEDIKDYWSLNTSQFNYAMYSDGALKVRDDSLIELRVECQLKKGLSQSDIARDNSVSQARVHYIAKRLGLLDNTRKKRTTLTDDELTVIKDKMSTGIPVSTLAEKYNVSRDTIYKRLR